MEYLTPPDHHGPPSPRWRLVNHTRMFPASAVSYLHGEAALCLFVFSRKRRLYEKHRDLGAVGGVR